MSRFVRIFRVGSQGDRLLGLRFEYDPDALAVVRDIPGRQWDKGKRIWTIPDAPEHLARLRESFARLGYDVGLEADVEAQAAAAIAGLERARAAKARGDDDIAFDYVTEPYAHQRAGLAFLAHGQGGALLWEMGLGKTKTALDFCEWLQARGWEEVHPGRFVGSDIRVLVICPNTVKRNWCREIEKHTGHVGYVVPEGTLAKRAQQYGLSRYTIINCEQLSYDVTARRARDIEWDVVIVDESTRFKEPRAKRTKQLHKLKARYRLILTGTPIQKPEDVWSQFEFVSPGTFGSNFFAFRDRYLQLDFFKNVVGIKPGMVKELRDRIDARSYRVLKADVLDLPPKVYADRRVEMSDEQDRYYRRMKDELRTEIEGRDDLTAHSILTLLLRLTQITAGLVGDNLGGYLWLDERHNAKLAELTALLEGELANEQVVIFGQYQKELEELARRFTSPLERIPSDTHFIPPILYGPTPEKVRAQIIDEFQAGQRRLLFAQSRTGGIGIDLFAAKTAIYYTRGWSLEEYLQSQDRLHRIGQTGTVSVLHLVAAGTVDEQIAKALAAKQNVADHLTGDDARRLAVEIVGR